MAIEAGAFFYSLRAVRDAVLRCSLAKTATLPFAPLCEAFGVPRAL